MAAPPNGSAVVKKATFITSPQSFFSSPSDALGICILIIAFVIVAIDLAFRGAWRGCALSAAWCAVVQQNGRPLDLPKGSRISQSCAFVGTVLALCCRAYPLARRRSQLTTLTTMPQSNALRDVGVVRTFATMFCLILSHLAMIACAIVPMSCDCLIDHDKWVVVVWTDVFHDDSLITIYISSIAAAFLAKYHRQTAGKGRRSLLLWTIIFSILQSIGIDRCPRSSDTERFLLIVMEVMAVALAQFLHYGTIDRLLTRMTGDHMLPM